MKTNIVIGYIISIVYAILGITITGSIFIDSLSLMINIIIGSIVLIISGLFYFQTIAMKKILQTINIKEKAMRGFYISNTLIHLIELTFGLLLLGMALHRTLSEGFAVFG